MRLIDHGHQRRGTPGILSLTLFPPLYIGAVASVAHLLRQSPLQVLSL